MDKKKYVCLRCQSKFVVELMTQQEARQKNMNLAPVTCDSCSSPDVQPLEKIES